MLQVVRQAAARAGIELNVSPHWFRHYLPFRIMSGSEIGLHFRSMISGPIMRSPRQFADIVLSESQATQKGEKAGRVVHSDRPFQSRWDCKSAVGGPLGHVATDLLRCR